MNLQHTHRWFPAMIVLLGLALGLLAAGATRGGASTAYWARMQDHQAYCYDGLAMAGEFEYSSATWIASQGGGYGAFVLRYDLLYYPDRWYGLILYHYATARYTDINCVYTP